MAILRILGYHPPLLIQHTTQKTVQELLPAYIQHLRKVGTSNILFEPPSPEARKRYLHTTENLKAKVEEHAPTNMNSGKWKYEIAHYCLQSGQYRTDKGLQKTLSLFREAIASNKLNKKIIRASSY